MRNGYLFLLVALCTLSQPVNAQGANKDVFKGKLFPPNVILENQLELDLSKEQFTAIRKAVVDVQAHVAEHEWDLREAYQRMLLELDKKPIDEQRVLDLVNAALIAENQVKKQQVTMLIRLRNLLNDEQIDYLESVRD
ncbi:MAG: hypothetical protein KJO82_08120 [Gammaproteobacteria bacterium]|nr:hypothetical protein [Gammaproteobacteria bacterium]